MNRVPEQRHVAEHLPEAIRQRLDRAAKQSPVADAVLGGIDGCVTTFAVVSGVVGAGLPSSVALVLGFANLLADGFSMAISNYESIKADREYIQSVRQSEQEHIDTFPQGEQEEIRQIFSKKGFSGEVLEQIVGTISADRRLWIDTMLTEEHGVQISGRDPVRSALTTFSAFLLVGVIPLIPFMLPVLARATQFAVSAGLAAVVFFAIGAIKSRIYFKPVWRSGLGTLFTGGTASALAFLVGYLLREVLNIGAL